MLLAKFLDIDPLVLEKKVKMCERSQLARQMDTGQKVIRTSGELKRIYWR